MQVVQMIPTLRSFDEAKAREFYIHYLGFEIAFEHRFEANSPLYMGLTFGGIELHISEHYGDATPISSVRLELDNLDAYHEQLKAKKYKYARPDIQDQEWGFRELNITDPFGNRLVFCEPHQSIVEHRENRS